MFDRLVESGSTGADPSPRRKIFAASFIFVAALFATAVIGSIYAADFDLGNESFDIADLLSPVVETEPPREEPQPVRQQQTQTDPGREISRTQNILRIEESPTTAPTVSTEKSPHLSRPVGAFILNPNGADSNGPPPAGPAGTVAGSDNGSSRPTAADPGDPVASTPPPVPPRVEKPKQPKTGGVLTGMATFLPKPVYSAAARAVGAKGRVTVQITVDESGKVISAKAVDGNPILRPAAVEAAWKARFNPTLLTGVPVKVTGIITYNFT